MKMALLLLSLVQAQPDVSHERLGDGSYRLRVTVPGTGDVGAAQQLLVPTARRLCGDLPPRFGRHRFAGLERAETVSSGRTPVALELEQELHCGGEAPVEPPAAAPDPNWQPSAADEQTVRAATEGYYAARTQGRHAAAHAMLTERMQDMSPLAAFGEDARAEAARFGRGRRRVVQVTWYNNPPGSPVPGIYAATDFVGAFERLHFSCGYAVWLLQPGGGWRLVRTEEAVMERDPAQQVTAADVAAMRRQFNCRG
jgi:hypothetical protein